MKSMDPNEIRQMNPAMAHMSDEQIHHSSLQLELMADNPAMLEFAMNQMKRQQQSRTTTTTTTSDDDPLANAMKSMAEGQDDDVSKLLEAMTPAQLKVILTMLQGNTAMINQISTMSGIPPDKIKDGLTMFVDMPESRLGMALILMKWSQRIKTKWTAMNLKVGGHLLLIVIFLFLVFGYGLIRMMLLTWAWFWSNRVAATATARTLIQSTTTTTPGSAAVAFEEIPVLVEEDEFAGSEF
jgi:hypothetical protein